MQIMLLVVGGMARIYANMNLRERAAKYAEEAIDDEGLEFQCVIPRSPREQDSQNGCVFGGPVTE